MTDCIVGGCLRPPIVILENQPRCQPHAAELAARLREEPPVERKSLPPVRRSLADAARSKIRRFGMSPEELSEQPLIIRIRRGITVGVDRRTGRSVEAAPGDQIDVIDLQRRGILSGFSSGEEFAAALCFGQPWNPKAELVNEEDRSRIVKPGPVTFGGR